jgi:hypothetical protein
MAKTRRGSRRRGPVAVFRTVLFSALAALVVSGGAQRPAWKKPYEVLPAPASADAFRDKLKGKNTAIWQEGDILTVLHRDAREGISLQGGLQMPMNKIPGTDLWVLQLRMPGWEKAFFSYLFMSTSVPPQGPIKFERWSGAKAPDSPVRATKLQGQIIDRTLHSDSMGVDRKLTIYLPPHAPKSGLPAFFMADGQACKQFANVLEPLILSGKVRPTAIIGVHSGTARVVDKDHPDWDARSAEYLRGGVPEVFAKHMAFFATEVPPYAVREFGISERAEDRAVVGFSNGGGLAFAAATDHPEVFGHSLPFSPSRVLEREAAIPSPMPTFHFAAG